MPLRSSNRDSFNFARAWIDVDEYATTSIHVHNLVAVMTHNYSYLELSTVYARVSRPPPFGTHVDPGLCSVQSHHG